MMKPFTLEWWMHKYMMADIKASDANRNDDEENFLEVYRWVKLKMWIHFRIINKYGE